jgi:hypothetical protein
MLPFRGRGCAGVRLGLLKLIGNCDPAVDLWFSIPIVSINISERRFRIIFGT